MFGEGAPVACVLTHDLIALAAFVGTLYPSNL